MKSTIIPVPSRRGSGIEPRTRRINTATITFSAMIRNIYILQVRAHSNKTLQLILLLVIFRSGSFLTKQRSTTFFYIWPFLALLELRYEIAHIYGKLNICLILMNRQTIGYAFNLIEVG